GGPGLLAAASEVAARAASSRRRSLSPRPARRQRPPARDETLATANRRGIAPRRPGRPPRPGTGGSAAGRARVRHSLLHFFVPSKLMARGTPLTAYQPHGDSGGRRPPGGWRPRAASSWRMARII